MEEQTVSESNLKHTTFDFALYLELPQHTPQVRPLYVKFCFCVDRFGVCDEAACRQVNFIFHEGRSWAKLVRAFMLQMLCCPWSTITSITTLRSESWRCMPTTTLARIKICPSPHTLPGGWLLVSLIWFRYHSGQLGKQGARSMDFSPYWRKVSGLRGTVKPW